MPEALPPQTVHCGACEYETLLFDDGSGLSLPECPHGCDPDHQGSTTMQWGGADDDD